jgi:hypothetical protein
LLLPAQADAQRTADQARLMFSLGVGQLSGGGTLWSVGRQPFTQPPNVADTMNLSRQFRRNLVVSMSGTYFPGSRVGLNVEVQLIGLGTQDQCTMVTAAPDSADASILCRNIDRAERSATSAAMSVGAIYRLASHSVIHPYVRANAGLVFTQHSFIRTSGTIPGPQGPATVEMFSDERSTTVSPYLSLGGGLVTVIGRGYQLRFELRDNYVRLPAVSGATSGQFFVPPTDKVGKHLLTFIVAFDVVLERKRGRRY